MPKSAKSKTPETGFGGQTEQRIKQWSYSRWTVYEDCPKRAKYKFLDRLPEPGSEALNRGAEIHGCAESYLRGKVKKIDPRLEQISAHLKELKRDKAEPELEMAVTDKWAPTTWWASDVWARAKLDAKRVLGGKALEVTDFKTGRYKPGDEGYRLQLELYGVFTLAAQPEFDLVNARLLFTDHGKEENMEFRRKEFPALKTRWERRVRPMLNDTVFPTRPGTYCRWCSYSKSKNGPCEY